MNPGWHLGVMCAFDTETTGPDPETALIVSACVVHVDGGGTIPPEPETWLIDPGCEIPAEATAVHGITTERARKDGTIPEVALKDISGALIRSARGAIPIVAFNAPFDLTILDRETRRNGLDPFGDQWGAAKGTVIDPYVLDKALDPYRKGSRTLTAACAHYGVRLDGAHDAAADAIAAARLAWKIAARYPHVAAMSMTALHAFQVKARRDQARSYQDFLRRQGSAEVIDGSWPLKPRADDTAPEAVA